MEQPPLPPEFEVKPRLTPLAFIIRFSFGFAFGFAISLYVIGSPEWAFVIACACGLGAAVFGDGFWEKAADLTIDWWRHH